MSSCQIWYKPIDDKSLLIMVVRRYGMEKYVTILQKLLEFSNFDVYRSSQRFKTNFTQNDYIGCVPTV